MRFSYWLSVTCQKARENVEKSPAAISAISGLDPSTIYKFEDKGTWPRQPDDLVAAYAKAAGIEDARELWDMALRMWHRHGQAPRLMEDGKVAVTRELERELDEFLTKREEVSPEVARERRAARN